MNPIPHNITTQRTARYYTLGDPSTATEIWFVLHGYAHRAESFIESFRPIESVSRLIVAPEALSRFYTKGFGGTVGASWMTREDRLNEIKDYVNYLNTLYAEIISSLPSPPTKIVALGFSQGVPALLRWLAGGRSKVNDVVIWSGDVPRDLAFPSYKKHTSSSKHHLLIGDNDTIVRPEIYHETEKLLNDNGILFTKNVFAGGHEISAEALILLVSHL
jgi:predicted esterase